MYKRFVRWTVGLIVGALLVCALVVYVVDPFQQYRAASWYVPVFDGQVQAYSNAGIAKNYEYDTLILGSSMVENTKTSQVDELFGGQSIKICFSGGMAMNHDAVLDLAFQHQELQRVFYGLDMYSFIHELGYSSFKMPWYLYNRNPFDDVSYLLSDDVCFGRVGSALKQNLKEGAPKVLDRDRMYYWGDEYVYGEDIMLGTWDFRQPAKEMEPYDAYAENVEANFAAYIQPHLEAHPETEFIFFFPPYSSLEWYIMLQKGHLDFVQDTKERLTELLLEYDNVKLYDFTAYTPWIEDLSLYKDYSHYKPEVNQAMIDKIARDELRVRDIYDVYENDEVLYGIAENFEVPY